MAPKKKDKEKESPPPAPEPPVEQEEEPPAEETPPEPPRDPPRGSVGHLLEDAFKDLYPQPQASSVQVRQEDVASEEAAEGATAADGEGQPRAGSDEVDVTAEDEEIAAIQTQMEGEQARLDAFSQQMRQKGQEAVDQDRQQAAHLQQRWGLVMREQMPVPESNFKSLMEQEKLAQEGLLVPRETMEDVEQQIEFNKGTIAPHENLLGLSRPDKPGYLKETTINNIRYQVRNIQPTLAPAQKTAVSEALEKRLRTQPPAAATMNPDEVLRNREIMKKMSVRVNFQKNPRSLADRKAAERGEPCPFDMMPDQVVFRNYEAGGVYQIEVEFRNTSSVGRSLRVIPPKGGAFCAEPLRYEGANPATAMIAPGMAAHLTVNFAPTTLNDVADEINVCTELGNYKLPVVARRLQPRLVFADPVDCGRILAGSTNKITTQLTNVGGEGSFRLVPVEESGIQCHYATREGGETSFVSDMFRVTPASFYLEPGQKVELSVTFSSSEVGEHSLPFLVECDNGAMVPLTLSGIADALRLELAGWPTLVSPVRPSVPPPGVSPWSLVPWRLNWLSPGTQVGCSSSQSIVIANGGFLPAPVEWRLLKVPRKLVSRLTVGSQQRLTEDLFTEMTDWAVCTGDALGSKSCPFKVSPPSAVIAPFSTTTFTFQFQAHAPVGHRAVNFACLQAKKLPAEKHCLLPFDRLLELQSSMPHPEGYSPGLPLAGGAVGPTSEQQKRVIIDGGDASADSSPRTDASICTVTAVCLQGVSVASTVSCLPKAVIMSGDVLPFVTHSRTIRLRNAGPMPACFRVRLTSSELQKEGGDDIYESLWVVSADEAGPRPEEPEAALQEGSGSQEEQMRLHAKRLASQWPPLPPDGPDASSQLPGFGSVASAAVVPHEGSIPAHGFVDVQVCLRVLREVDLNASFIVDLPVSLDQPDSVASPPLKVGVIAAVRAPQVELRRTSLLNYGVVRAHSRQTKTLHVRNPSELPLLVRLRHLRDEAPADSVNAEADPSSSSKPAKLQPAAEAHFPLHSHQEVVDFYLGFLATGSSAGRFKAVPGEPVELPAEPWVHSRDGCMDLSGRRVFSEGRAFRGRKTSFEEALSNGEVDRQARVDDSEDFVFSPSCLVLWPHQSAEVDVLLRTSAEGKYRAILEAVGFDSLQSQCVEVWAEVQLPSVRVSTQHVHFPKAYLNVATSAYELEVRNESDLPANYRWEVPLNFGAGLEVQIGPPQGSVPPRSAVSVSLVATPTRKGSDSEVQCKLYVQDVLQALQMRITARVFGCQVDYAVIPMGGTPPAIRCQPRELDTEPCNTYPVLSGPAQPGMPMADFGSMELLHSKSLQVVLYNRTAIASPFSLKIDKFAAYDPLQKGKCIGDLLDAATRLHSLGATSPEPSAEEKLTFSSQPEPAAQGRKAPRESTLQPTQRPKFEPKARTRTLGKSGTMRRKQQKWLLDDKHEKQAFRSGVGEAFVSQREQREAGVLALKLGRGWAVKVEPATDWLQPFSSTVVTLTCYSDLPGTMEDDLVVKIQQLDEHQQLEGLFRIPVRLKSFGNPLYLPAQQVGINYDPAGELDPPQLLCGVTTPADKQAMRTFKVGNNSSVKMRIAWKVFPRLQVENTDSDRQLVNIALCKKKHCPEDPFFANDEVLERDETEDGAAADAAAALVDPPFEFEMWAEEPPEIKDPFAIPESTDLPVRVEPVEAVVPAYGTAAFNVTMTATKSTAAAAGHYRYHIVGKGRFTEDREAELLAIEEANSPKASPRLLSPSKTMDSAKVASAERSLAAATRRPQSTSQDEVKALPTAPLGNDSDSDDEAGRAEARARKRQVEAQARALEAAAEMAAEADSATGGPKPYMPEAKLAEEPEGDILSTIVIEAVGDCILPRLTVDKKADPVMEDFPLDDPDGDGIPGTCPVFKFTHSACTPGREDGQLAKGRATGATLSGLQGGPQAAGMLMNTVRRVNLVNRNACNVYCKFRVEGPFRIRQVDQAGQHPVKALKEKGAKPSLDPNVLYTVGKLETVTLLVEFLPELVQQPTVLVREHVSRGDVLVDYPRDTQVSNAKSDQQRIHLQGVIQRPAVNAFLVPCHLDRPVAVHHAGKPAWGEPEVVNIDFGFVHVEGSVTCKRRLLLSNESGVVARWRLVHVGRRKKPPADIGATTREEEDLRALDDKDAFEFDVCEGELQGPSKGGRDPTGKFVPHYCPRSSALPQRAKHREEHVFEPQEVVVSFNPSKNELYKCRFRIQVESGPSIDFVCRGCGSYDEEDDVLDFKES